MRVELWTDGSGTSSGPFGWAFILRAYGSSGLLVAERIGMGAGDEGTNNRAELTALLEGLRALRASSTVTVCTDSEYVMKPFTERYLELWRERGWRKLSGGPVANVDLWEEVDYAAVSHDLTFKLVPGHSGIELNEQCDRLAGLARLVVKDHLNTRAEG